MKEDEIKQEIVKKVNAVRKGDYSIWTIGITDDPDRRKQEHGNPGAWRHWRADTETIARNVEKYFLEKGMKGAPGGGENPNYVYIF